MDDEPETTDIDATAPDAHASGPSALASTSTTAKNGGPSDPASASTAAKNGGPSALASPLTAAKNGGPSAMASASTVAKNGGPSALASASTAAKNGGPSAPASASTADESNSKSQKLVSLTKRSLESPAIKAADGGTPVSKIPVGGSQSRIDQDALLLKVGKVKLKNVVMFTFFLTFFFMHEVRLVTDGTSLFTLLFFF